MPTIVSGSAVAAATVGATDYIDVTFSEAVYTGADGTGILTDADFNNLSLVVGANGTATSVTKEGARKPNNSDFGVAAVLTGDETVVRLFFTTAGAVAGVETIEVKPASGAAIYDIAGNAVAGTQTTGTKLLRDNTIPVIAIVSDNGATYVNETDVVNITFYVTEVGTFTSNPTVAILQNGGAAINPAQTATYFSRSGTGVNGDPFFYTYKYTVPS